MAWNGSNMQQKNQLINWSTDLWRFRMVPTSTFYDTDPSQPQWKHFFHCRAASSRSRTWRITDLIRTLAKPSPNDQSEYRLQLPKQCEIFYKSLRKSYANQLQLKGSVWIMYVCIYVYINIYQHSIWEIDQPQNVVINISMSIFLWGLQISSSFGQPSICAAQRFRVTWRPLPGGTSSVLWSGWIMNLMIWITLWLFNSLPWYRWPIEIDCLPV
jgi:hypothetical protein